MNVWLIHTIAPVQLSVWIGRGATGVMNMVRMIPQALTPFTASIPKDSGSGAQLTVTPDSQNGVFEQPCVIESVDSVSKDGPNTTYMNTELSTSTPDITTGITVRT